MFNFVMLPDYQGIHCENILNITKGVDCSSLSPKVMLPDIYDSRVEYHYEVQPHSWFPSGGIDMTIAGENHTGGPNGTLIYSLPGKGGMTLPLLYNDYMYSITDMYYKSSTAFFSERFII